MTRVVGIVPEPVIAVPIIEPARMINDRIEANALELNALLRSRQRLAANVTKPTRAPLVLDSRLCDEERTPIASVNFEDDIAKRTITRVIRIDERAAENPLIVNVVIAADDVEIFFSAPKFGSNPAANHVPSLEL